MPRVSLSPPVRVQPWVVQRVWRGSCRSGAAALAGRRRAARGARVPDPGRVSARRCSTRARY